MAGRYTKQQVRDRILQMAAAGASEEDIDAYVRIVQPHIVDLAPESSEQAAPLDTTREDDTRAEAPLEPKVTPARPPEPIRMKPAVVMAERPAERFFPEPAPVEFPTGSTPEPVVPPPAPPDRTKAAPPGVYEKHGYRVIDTNRRTPDGHVPTHRLDQPTNRRPNETFEQYEDRVLARTEFSPDTAARRDLESLDRDVADSARALLKAAKAANKKLSIAETRRTQERQEMLFQKGRANTEPVATWTLTSDHTPGRAIDFTGNKDAFRWLQEHAPKYGFSVLGDLDPGHVAMPQAPRADNTRVAAAPPAGPQISEKNGPGILDRAQSVLDRVREFVAENRRAMTHNPVMDIHREIAEQNPSPSEELGAIAGDADRNIVARGAAAAASLPMAAIENPIGTAADLATMPLRSAGKLAQYAAEHVGPAKTDAERRRRMIEEREERVNTLLRNPTPTPTSSILAQVKQAMGPEVAPPVSDREAKFAAAQIAALEAGPALGRAAGAAVRGSAPAVSVRGYADRMLQHAVPAAAVGGAYSEESPEVGAVGGGILGAVSGLLAKERVRVGPYPSDWFKDSPEPTLGEEAGMADRRARTLPSTGRPSAHVTSAPPPEVPPTQPESFFETIRKARGEQPVAEQQPQPVAPAPPAPKEPAPSQRVAVRTSEIRPEGAFFARPGSAQFKADAETIPYDIGELKIADTGNPDVAHELLRSAFNDPSLSQEVRLRLASLISEQVPSIDADLAPVLAPVGKQLGYDGVQLFESEDAEQPRALFVWNLRKVMPETEAPKAAPKEPPARPAVGSDAGNGFRIGADGYRYRVGRIHSTGGVALEKRHLKTEGASTFYVGAEGGLVDADNIQINRPATLEQIWKPKSAEAEKAATDVLREMGETPLADPKRKVLKDRLKEIVANDGVERAVERPSDYAAEKAAGRGLTDDEELEESVRAGEMTQQEADQKAAFRRYSEWRRSFTRAVRGDDVPTFDEWLVDEGGEKYAREILGREPEDRNKQPIRPDDAAWHRRAEDAEATIEPAEPQEEETPTVKVTAHVPRPADDIREIGRQVDEYMKAHPGTVIPKRDEDYAREEGEAAARAGKPRNVSHIDSMREREAWLEGYDEAKRAPKSPIAETRSLIGSRSLDDILVPAPRPGQQRQPDEPGADIASDFEANARKYSDEELQQLRARFDEQASKAPDGSEEQDELLFRSSVVEEEIRRRASPIAQTRAAGPAGKRKTKVTPIDVRNAGVDVRNRALDNLHTLVKAANLGDDNASFKVAQALDVVSDRRSGKPGGGTLLEALRKTDLRLTPEIEAQVERFEELDRAADLANQAAGIYPWESVKKARRILAERGMDAEKIEALGDGKELMEAAFPEAPPEKKPVTPQVEPDWKYVLPSFVTEPHKGPVDESQLPRVAQGLLADLRELDADPAALHAQTPKGAKLRKRRASLVKSLRPFKVDGVEPPPMPPAPEVEHGSGTGRTERHIPAGVDLEDAANMPNLTDADTPMVKAARVYTVEHGSTMDIDTPERDALRHEKIALHAEDVQHGSAREKVVGLLLGLPGSGKSTIAGRLANHIDGRISDVDHVKADLREYEEGWGSEVVYKEAGAITKAARDMLEKAGVNYVWPGVGVGTDAYLAKLDELHKLGYTVHLVHVVVPPEVAKQRVVARFESGGHFVRPEYIDLVGRQDHDTYEAAKKHPAVVSYARIDNSGDEPRIVEEHNATWLGPEGNRSPEPEHGRGRADQHRGRSPHQVAARTDTPEFRKWFGDSKVVDKQGKPLVVHHGTEAPEFDRFDMPAFFTSDAGEAMSFYAGGGKTGHQGRGRVISVYLRMEHPLYIDNRDGSLELITLAEEAGVKTNFEDGPQGWSIDVPAVREHSPYGGENIWDMLYVPQVREALKAAGYDGVFGWDQLHNSEIETFVPLDADQILRVGESPPSQRRESQGSAVARGAESAETGGANVNPRAGETGRAGRTATVTETEARPVGTAVPQLPGEERSGPGEGAEGGGRAPEGGGVDRRAGGDRVRADDGSGNGADVEGGAGAGRGGEGDEGAPAGGGTRDVERGGAGSEVDGAEPGRLHGREHRGLGRRAVPPEGAAADEHLVATPDGLQRPTGTNYRLTDADDIGGGAPKTKVRQNLAAIKLLRELRESGREIATPDEQAILAKYVGWGAFPNYFDRNKPEYSSPEGKELRDALAPADYEEARASTVNAHYTSPEVIGVMWEMMRRFGVDGARALEPAMGVGNFVGFAPRDMSIAWTGVEKDPTTGHIAKYLYPESDIHVSGFEDVALRNGTFDIAISNVPFGDFSVYDPKYKHLKGFSIHDYFFAKTLDKVRPGGIVAFITSRYTMDKASLTVRKYIGERADLLGAIRLPYTAFKGNAGTEVITDIIVLRVRAKDAPAAGEPWLNLKRIDLKNRFDEDADIAVNEYYARHPEMVLGTPRLDRGQYSDNEYVVLPGKTPLQEALRTAVRALPKDALLPRPEAVKAQDAAIGPVIDAPADAKVGTYLIRDDKIMQVGLDGRLVADVVPKSQALKVRSLIGLRDMAAELVKMNADPAATDAAIEAKRKPLEKAYRAFVKKHGPINLEKRSEGTNKKGIHWVRRSYPNWDVIADDPGLAQILALEHYDTETDKGVPADLITKGRVIPPATEIARADTGFDAMVASLAKLGKLDLDYMASLRGISVAELHRELKGEIFEDPSTGDWQIKAKYLSGNVRDKLELAKRAAKTKPQFRANVEALEKVVPPDTPAQAIQVRFGARWIANEEYEQFIRDLFEKPDAQVTVRQDAHSGSWSVEADWRITSSVDNSTKYGTNKFTALEIIEKSMNSQPLRAIDRLKIPGGGEKAVPNKEATAVAVARQKLLLDRFRAWLFKEDPKRSAELVRRWNDQRNNTVPPKYDGSMLVVPGIATHVAGNEFKWYEHQKNAIMRYVQNGNILLAHAPGAGKTYTFVAMAMEARRFGFARRPMIAVPNHMLAQATREAQQLYPGARILALSTDDTSAKAKQLLAARAASSEWDLIITTHNGMGRIPMSKAAQADFLREELEALREAMLEENELAQRTAPRNSRGKPRSIKRMEKVQEEYETRLKAMMDSPADTLLTFEELGVDLLIVDEAHLFKNLHFPTRIEGIQVGDSKSATQLYMKTKYLHRINPTHGIVFATGTPVTNSIAELHTMKRYVSPRTLRDRGLERFDDWAAEYATLVTRMEKNTVGNYEVKSRLAKYVNVPSMIQMFRDFADVKTIEELGLPRPPLIGGKAQGIVAPEPAGMRALLEELREQWEKLKKMSPEEAAASGMSFLSIGNRARHAGLDMRLVDRSVRDEDGPFKVDEAADKIVERYQKHSAYKGAQVVFCDLATPKAADAINNLGGRNGYSVYTELKRLLVAKGIPATEIAFSQDASSDAKKRILFRKVNSGEVRVVIGSTSQMGVGTNMQQRLVALHRLDVPWRPDQIEQSEARILRMGNILYKPKDGSAPKIDGVEILRYVTEGSYDQYSWDTVLRKAKFIAQAMTGDPSIAELDEIPDEAAQSAQLMAALASNNPLELERADVAQQLADLQAEAQGHRQEQHDVLRKIERAKRDIRDDNTRMKGAALDAKRKEDTAGDKFRMTVGGKEYTERKAAGEAVNKALAAIEKGKEATIGTIGGFELTATAVGGYGYTGHFDSLETHNVGFPESLDSELGTIARIESALRHVGHPEEYPPRIAKYEQTVKELEQLIGRPFERQDELDRLEARLKEIESTLLQQGTPTTPTDIADEDLAGPSKPEGDDDLPPLGGATAFSPDPVTMLRMAAREAAKIPAVKAAAAKLADVADDVRKFFAPASRTDEAQLAASVARHRRAEMERDVERAVEALKGFRRAMFKLPVDVRYDFIDRMEHGTAQATPELTRAANVLRLVLDHTRTEVQKLGTGALEQYIEHYFPHVWKDPTAFQDIVRRILGKRPLQGPKSFLKQRKIEYFGEGIQRGLEPVSDNPVDLVMLKVREMKRYIFAQRLWHDLKKRDLVKFVRSGRSAPEGYAKVDDAIATVFAGFDEEGALRIRGQYWAPEPVATLLNNYLKPGYRGHALYDAWNWAGNVLNSVQLGFSAFHLGFTSIDATVSKAALAVDQLQSGQPVKALWSGVQAATLVTPPLTNIWRGNKVLKEYLNAGSVGGVFADMVDAVVKSGGRVRMDSMYRMGNLDKLVDAARELRQKPVTKGLSIVLHAPFAAIELSMKPILEVVVPRQKLGVFADLAMHAIDRLRKRGASEDEIRMELARIWDSVDNRMGQLVYDNLFWKRTRKDLALVLVRSVGWNWGTIREVGGGAADFGANIRDVLTGKKTRLSYRTQYVLALFGVTALLGAILNYLFTGEGPKEMKDYFFPRTGRKDHNGNPDRWSLPTYVKDLYAYKHHALQTLGHKLHPLLTLVSEVMHNRDYYGNMVRDPEAPTDEQLVQSIHFWWEQMKPFSVQGALESAERGEPASHRAGSFVGLTPAPRETVRTPAQNMMYEYLARRPRAAQTPTDVELAQERREQKQDLREAREAHDTVAAKGIIAKVREARQDGDMSRRQMQGVIRGSRTQPLEGAFKQLQYEEAVRVYEKGEPWEQAIWYRLLRRKAIATGHMRDFRERNLTRPAGAVNE